MVNLNVKKETFRKYLLENGFNFKILDFENFILKIKSYILNDYIKNSSDKEYLHKIFSGEEPPLSVLNNLKYMKFVHNKYFKKIIKRGIVDGYIEYYEDTFSDDEIKNAYFIKVVEHFIIYGIDGFMSEFIGDKYIEYFDRNVFQAKSRYILENKLINLSFEEKEIIFNDIIEEMKEYYLKSIYMYGFNNIFHYQGLLTLIGIRKNTVEYTYFLDFLSSYIFKDFKISIDSEDIYLDHSDYNFIENINFESLHNEIFTILDKKVVLSDIDYFIDYLLFNEDSDLLSLSIDEKPDDFDFESWEFFLNKFKPKAIEIKEAINNFINSIDLRTVQYTLYIGKDKEYDISLIKIKDYINERIKLSSS